MNIENAKKRAALAAIAEMPDSGTIGLGTGSTAKHFVEALAVLVRQGRNYVGVPTSEQSRALAEALGIPLLGADGPWDIEVTVDGADEVDLDLNLIKGGGGAHTREKIVNAASRRNVIIVDEEKLSPHLGARWSVPIEVLVFAHCQTAQALSRFGKPVLRARPDVPVRTDAGNLIYDLACGPIRDPKGLDDALRSIPGVVETGLFVGRVDLVLVADGAGNMKRLERRH